MRLQKNLKKILKKKVIKEKMNIISRETKRLP